MLHPRCTRHLSDKPSPMQASGVDDEGRKGKEVYWSRPWSHLRLSVYALGAAHARRPWLHVVRAAGDWLDSRVWTWTRQHGGRVSPFLMMPRRHDAA